MPIFSPPYEIEWTFAEGVRSPSDKRFWSHVKGGRGHTVIRTGGVYRTVSNPSHTELEAADDIRAANGELVKAVFLGGHVHQVTSDIADELAAAGYPVTEMLGGYHFGYEGGY